MLHHIDDDVEALFWQAWDALNDGRFEYEQGACACDELTSQAVQYIHIKHQDCDEDEARRRAEQR